MRSRPLIAKLARAKTPHEASQRANIGIRAMGMRHEARVTTDGSAALRPNPEAAWNRYREEEQRGRRKKALPHLIDALRLWNADPDASPWRKQEARDALKILAMRMGRADVLAEFGL